MTIPKFQAYVRLLINGHPSRPFSMRTLKLKPPPRFDRKLSTIRRTSRHRYNHPLMQVQREMAKVLGGDIGPSDLAQTSRNN